MAYSEKAKICPHCNGFFTGSHVIIEPRYKFVSYEGSLLRQYSPIVHPCRVKYEEQEGLHAINKHHSRDKNNKDNRNFVSILMQTILSSKS